MEYAQEDQFKQCVEFAHPGVSMSAPTRATTVPTDATGRKAHPVASGVMDYFPDALVAIAHVSKQGNDQHNPGQPLHWARGKSADEADALIRHFLQRGGFDTDGLRHSAKMAWRALALLQKEIEATLTQENVSRPLPLGQNQNPITREHVRTDCAVPLSQIPADIEEGSYRLTIERERY